MRYFNYTIEIKFLEKSIFPILSKTYTLTLNAY
ncbi:hypothetical protein CLV81_0026 [Flagellimonas meridianipacifica]|uniref:Uncharacterized protein n=1 Tax=Flagellimonas meridianipacifica TaxID=1080225 RepID=A0A2T0MEP4_9FLAO|nr:hypothetical protein CLV81_0026 [Allomuricauda pacifica]